MNKKLVKDLATTVLTVMVAKATVELVCKGIKKAVKNKKVNK